MRNNSYRVPATLSNGRSFEIDHLIPLELGGSNELANLRPQPYRRRPAAREKDLLENHSLSLASMFGGRWRSEPPNGRLSPATMGRCPMLDDRIQNVIGNCASVGLASHAARRAKLDQKELARLKRWLK